MLCMVGSGNGASKWAEMLIGHVWGSPVVGTTYYKTTVLVKPVMWLQKADWCSGNTMHWQHNFPARWLAMPCMLKTYRREAAL